MLALSPSLSTSFGWPMEDHLITQNLQQDYCYDNNSREATANSESLLGFPFFDQDHDHDHDQNHAQQDFAQENSSFLGGGDADCGTSTDQAAVAKKLNHNASERDRRRRVNDLYSFLRSLLPASRSQKKKVSIPGTVSRVLKYIPELQKEVQTLIHRKEKLLSSSPIMTPENHEIKKLRGKDAIPTSCQSLAVCSVSVVGEKEAVMQLITSMNMNKKNKSSLLSEVIEYLEEEEDGVILVNATTFKCYGEERLLNTLHFKVKGNHKMDSETLKEKLCSFYQQIG